MDGRSNEYFRQIKRLPSLRKAAFHEILSFGQGTCPCISVLFRTGNILEQGRQIGTSEQ